VNLRSLFGGQLLPDFVRGIHPPQNKSLTRDLPIEALALPDVVTVPLLQHMGAPAECLVKPRQQVEPGELIGRRASGVVSANVHASVAGTVQALTVVPLPNGRRCAAVPIKTVAVVDGADSNVPICERLFGGDWQEGRIAAVQPRDILAAVADAGIVGMGGAAFPTDVKLRTTPERPVATLLVNGCECEPFLTSDDRLMREFPAAIVVGARLAQKACGARQVLLAIESNKPEAADALRTASAHCPAFDITVVNTKYPMGGERQLIPAVFQREVPTGGLPLDLGIAVINVATAAAIAGAVLRGHAMTHRVVTVTGGGVRSPKNLLVPVGTSFQAVIDGCGGLLPDARRVLAGGPMMGFTVTDLSAPVTKGTGGITVLSSSEIDVIEQTACIRCGRCLDGCPLGLAPTRIAHAAKAGDLVLAQENHLEACCECGCCAYECPARIPLVQYIRSGKVELARSITESPSR
jgi:electron transport complex protein RnfC